MHNKSIASINGLVSQWLDSFSHRGKQISIRKRDYIYRICYSELFKQDLNCIKCSGQARLIAVYGDGLLGDAAADAHDFLYATWIVDRVDSLWLVANTVCTYCRKHIY